MTAIAITSATSGCVMVRAGQLWRALRSLAVVLREDDCSASVMGAPIAIRGGPTSIRSISCTTWTVKFDA